jgi:hypothetical protein
MRNLIGTLFLGFSLILTGCARDNLSPFSPRAEQRIQNQGKIESIKTTQDSIMREVGQIRSEISGNNNKSMNSSGTANSSNAGVQILSGDGALIVLFGLGALAILGGTAAFYHSKATKAEKTAEIFAQQIALHNNPNLDDGVLLAAMNSNVEDHVYAMLVKQQNVLGRRQSIS